LRLSKLFGRTLREAPAKAELMSHQLLLRAGFIRPLTTGIYSYLPLGCRALHKIEHILRQEMDGMGGQEVYVPVVRSPGLGQRTGQPEDVGPEDVHFGDQADRGLVLTMTHEEVAARLVRQELRSYRDLPCMIYQIHTKFRDERRPRAGLMRIREFTMKDAYSCHADFADLDAFYHQMYAAYERIFARCELEILAVEANTEMMAGSASHEFMVLNDQGEDALILCPGCGYAANREQAAFDKGEPADVPLARAEEVATPGCTTIAQVADYLGVSRRQTLKAVLYTSDRTGQVTIVVIRGDLEVSQAKLGHVLGADAVHPATGQELDAARILPGYASPLGLKGVRVVADDSLTTGVNFVAGANREGYHVTGVNYPRDFEVDVLADIALAQGGHTCAHCGSLLEERRGMAVGHLFKLGTRYSEKVGATFLDSQGRARLVVMGSYGILLGRLLAAIVEQHHDGLGIVWPLSVAPYHIHLLSLGGDEPVEAQAEVLYERLLRAGYEVLYDDRRESAGVEFNDADLIGLPLRLTVSRRTQAQRAVEWKLRSQKERELVALEDLRAKLEEIFPTETRTS